MTDEINRLWRKHWAAAARCPESNATSHYDIERAGFRAGYLAHSAALKEAGMVVVPRVLPPEVENCDGVWGCALAENARGVWEEAIEELERRAMIFQATKVDADAS
jgi:hypothetical protein